MATNERFMPVPPQAVWDALADAGGYGYTTAKVSSQHGMIYARLRSRFTPDGDALQGPAVHRLERKPL